MLQPWQTTAIYAVIVSVSFFLVILFFGKKAQDDEGSYFLLGCACTFWPFSLMALGCAAAFFLMFVLPYRIAIRLHHLTDFSPK